MARTYRVPTTVALFVCLLGGPWGGTLFAADGEPSPIEAPAVVSHSSFSFTDQILAVAPPSAAIRAHAWRGTFNFVPDDSNVFAQRRGFRGRGSRNGGPAAAIVLGAAAAIAGAAVLVYANRPECRTTGGEGCGYGTKVVGGAVLSAGVVGIIGGALTWR